MQISPFWKGVTKYSIIVVVALALLVGVGWGAYKYGKKVEQEQIMSIQPDSTLQIKLDSMFRTMLERIDSTAKDRQIIYNNTERVYNKIIKIYEKADTMRPYVHRDSLLRSLTTISNTPR